MSALTGEQNTETVRERRLTMSCRFFRKIIAFVLVCLLLAYAGFGAEITQTDGVQDAASLCEEYGVDLSLIVELNQFTAVYRTFLMNEQTVPDEEDSVLTATVFIPENSEFLNAENISTSVYLIQYACNGIKYTVAYYADGTVEKYAAVLGTTKRFQVSNTDFEVQYKDLAEASITRIDASAGVRTAEYDEITQTYTIVPNVTTYSSTSARIVRMYPSYTTDPDFAPRNALVVASGVVTIPEMSALGYSESLGYSVYKTMDYYEQVKLKTEPYDAGTAIVQVAAEMCISSSVVLSALYDAEVISSITATHFYQDVEFIWDETYKFQGGVEVGIYDPITYKRQVEAYSLWDEGTFGVTWDTNAALEYYNPEWRHVITSKGFTTPVATAKSIAIENYSNQIALFGCWTNDPGNGFGY